MSVLGIGVDLVECARIEHSIERFGDRFLNRVFTAGEIEYSKSMKYPARHLAARFAAKEASQKRLAPALAKQWVGATSMSKTSGEPFLVLTDGAEELAKTARC